MKKFRQELNALNDMQTQLESWKLKHNEQIEADLKLINHTPVSLNTTQLVHYEDYRKRGGTDSAETWLYKNDIPNLFP